VTGHRAIPLAIAIAGAALLSCASGARSAQDQSAQSAQTQTQQQGTEPAQPPATEPAQPPMNEPQQGTEPPESTEPQQGTAPEQGTEGSEGTTGQQTTLSGQLSKNDMGGYILVEEQSGDSITLQGPEDLADHVGTKVTVTGRWATDADGNQYFEVSTVAPA
jgi:glucose/arabinose dehydrogenase